MRATILSAAGAALLLLFAGCCSSCQRTSEVARGQAPAASSGDQWCEEDCCDEDGNCRHCWGHGCCHCRGYRVPNNLVYPPQVDFAGGAVGGSGIVQYPYYTCKGPDCFFVEPNPVRKQ
ncbi:MAG: hypothetical protein HY290_31370 [Planctomycetia bacterium]|nr:hypothetical protein [Planctomycetia bacterium]